jgi:hypothetical protein
VWWPAWNSPAGNLSLQRNDHVFEVESVSYDWNVGRPWSFVSETEQWTKRKFGGCADWMAAVDLGWPSGMMQATISIERPVVMYFSRNAWRPLT